MRLGFAVQVLGRPQLRSHDGRRAPQQPHLSVSLAYLRDILVYMAETGLHMYRMHPDLAPYITHPEMLQFHHQIDECLPELEYVGQLARAADVRLSFHTDPYTVLNSADAETQARSRAKVIALARLLDAMRLPAEAVIVTHVGGLFDDKIVSLECFIAHYNSLPSAVQRRLVLENDDRHYSLTDTYRIHAQTGIPLVLDRLHFLLNNPDRLSLGAGLELALGTWPERVQPKVHFSSPRTEMKALAPLTGDDAGAGGVRPPLWSNHSDYVNPFEFVDFLRLRPAQPDFDVMLEAKAKDLAALRLQRDLETFAPELAV